MLLHQPVELRLLGELVRGVGLEAALHRRQLLAQRVEALVLRAVGRLEIGLWKN